MQNDYWLLQEKRLKPEDPLLHWHLRQLTKGDVTPHLAADQRRAMFYPSAGQDWLFPVLIGLPYCTDFFFHDESIRSRTEQNVRGTIQAVHPSLVTSTSNSTDSVCAEFIFDSVPRRIWIVGSDNKTFLDREIVLAFYFHRGDSPGEGGSGQAWDSELLPKLLKKADPTVGLRLLTDGEPGGLAEEVQKRLHRIKLQNSHRGRDYFYGVLDAR